MSDWLDHFAEAFVKQSNPRAEGFAAAPEKSGIGSAISRSSGPKGIAPTPKPVRNPQTRATPRAPKAQPPSFPTSVDLPKSFSTPAPPKIVLNSAKPVVAAFFKGVRAIPSAAWRFTPKGVKTVGAVGLGGVGAYKVGKGLYGHFSEEEERRFAQHPSLERQRRLANTYRYGSGTAQSSF
jgi:hypothetical protein